MNRDVNILDELKGISPLIAEIGNDNLFVVPDGYFDTIAGTLLICVKESRLQPGVETDAAVPPGYFDDLSSRILGKIKGTVANELTEISPVLAAIKKGNPFKVPDNYFEQVSAEVIAKLDNEALSLEMTNARVLQPFTVPQDYFENLPADILDKARQQAGAKVITMPKRSSQVLKYAAAAVFTGLVTLGVFRFTESSTGVTEGKNVSTTAFASVIKKGISIASDDGKFEEVLNNLNEEDIAKYLEKNNSEADMAVLKSGLDENNLPDQEDYLTDEKTLDNFIESLNSNN